jgi:hypothetical protein
MNSNIVRAAGLYKRPRGHVNTPPGTAAAVRGLVKRVGIVAAMDHFGLGRMAVCSLASEQTVQAQTLAAANDGLARVVELGAIAGDEP